MRPGPRIIHQLSLLRLTAYPGARFHGVRKQVGGAVRPGSDRTYPRTKSATGCSFR
jgi:hypothetical protein